LKTLVKYWENDTQLRDILITGGDALMSSDHSLKQILDEVYQLARRKRKANRNRAEGKKYAEIVKIRLGTRLPVYLPQRITRDLIKILSRFKHRAQKIGVKQFIVQTHIQSAMELTPEAVNAIKNLISAGWIVTNQLVFTTAASRRGHTAKLRQVLNEVGVIPYYTFSVKGFMENYHNFATNERAAQERVEEKYLGQITNDQIDTINHLPDDISHLMKNIQNILKKNNMPFLATDRSVLNMPGVGKSLTYRTIGITDDGRRILEFEHDKTRNHSPIINSMGSIVIIESKSINSYLKQLDGMGEDIEEYKTIWGYSASETESRLAIFNYPEYDFRITQHLSNFILEPKEMDNNDLMIKQ
jgi:lysine 2,3-aminomutase